MCPFAFISAFVLLLSAFVFVISAFVIASRLLHNARVYLFSSHFDRYLEVSCVALIRYVRRSVYIGLAFVLLQI